MAQQVELAVTPREVMGKGNKRLRKAGIIPANISGHKQASQAIQVEALPFDRLQRAHAATKIIALKLPDNTTQTVLIRQVQRGPRSGKIVHIDFSRVSLDEQVTVKIPLHFVGEAPAVKVEKGVMLHLLDTLEVACSASDIVDRIDVDISRLEHIDSILHVSDVKLPASYTLVTSPDEGVVKVAATRAEAAATPAEATATPSAATPEASGQ
ncbi:MAG: 50S ribosomal protein L25 [Ktedonobacteraceae bacterium]|nr:50S ribosomal protein L25 [Ktedonobacteraceae bacterium]